MGADAFVAVYGIKIQLNPEDEAELEACGLETDQRCIAAKRAGLQCHTGRMSEGEDYFLYIGQRLAWLGLEHDSYATQSLAELSLIAELVASRLRAAGFIEAPALHYQFVGQY